MIELPLTERVSERRWPGHISVIRTHKSAIWVSSVCSFHAFNAITLSRCAEWFSYRAIKPEMGMGGGAQRRQGNLTGHRSHQSRREFSLGGVYAAIDEDAEARAAARERGGYRQLQAIERQCECVSQMFEGRLPALAGVDQSGGPDRETGNVHRCLSCYLQITMRLYYCCRYTKHLEERKIKVGRWHFEGWLSLAVCVWGKQRDLNSVEYVVIM